MNQMIPRVIITILFYTVKASAQCSATVSCSGPCSCSTGSGTSSGTIDTGYADNWNCYWTITSSGLISLSFYRFSLETNYDYVTVSSNVQLCRASNPGGCTGPYTSNTGSLSVSLTADYSIVGSGIGANWNVQCPVTCGAGYTGTSSCTACPAGKYKIDTGSAACTDCGAGRYSTAVGAVVASTCLACGAGTYSSTVGAASASTCLACGAGTYSTTVGAASASNCLVCPAGSHSPLASQTVTACICYAGFTGPNGGTCTTCVAGKYKTTSDSVSCTDCAAGTYRTAANAASCTTTIHRSCGVSGTDTCSATQSSTLNNDAGLFADKALDQNMGTIFHTNANSVEWWMLDFGRSVMVTKVIVYNRQDCCWDRLNNYKITVGDSSSVNVNAVCASNLPAPMVSPYRADVLCATTLRGRYLHVSINSNWLHLAELQVMGCSDGGVCETCPAGTNSPIASTSSAACINPACNAGYTGPDGGTCTACVAGKYKIATGSAACTDCATGTYLTTTGATAAATCVACPAGSNSPISSSAPAACTCNTGSTGPDGGVCTSCVTGKYKTATGSATCSNCGTGTYSTTVGATIATTCIACPTNSNSPSSSSTVAACTCNIGFTGPDGGLTLPADSTNLVAWYKLNGDLTDSTGRTGSLINAGGTLAFAQDATLNSNLLYSWYAVGSGTSNVNYARTPTINRNVPISFAFWFKTTGSSTYTILSYGDKSVENPSIQFDWGGSSLSVATALSTQWNVQPIVTGLTLNTWYFVVYTLSNANPVSAILYIDGTQRATGTGAAGQTLPRIKDLTVANSGDTGRGFAGHVGDIRIYDKVLVQSEITALFTNIPTPCTTCVAGKYKIATGSAACTDCVTGTYSATTAATEIATCLACPTGTYSTTTAASAIADCLACPAGTYSPTTAATASAACLTCPTGTSSSVAGVSLCPCLRGTYVSTTSPVGSTSSAACVIPQCNVGYTGPSGLCTACVAGKYKSVPGSAACTDCGSGTYSTAAAVTAAAGCATCPANSGASCTSCSAAAGCTCNPGYALLNSVCVCDLGYQPGA